MSIKFSIAPLANDAPEYGLGKWNDPATPVNGCAWLINIPELPAGEYEIVKLQGDMGEPCIMISRIGPPGAYAANQDTERKATASSVVTTP